MARLPVAVVGASGYTGAELLRLLLDHPHAELGPLVAHARAGEPLARAFPQFAGRKEIEHTTLERFDAAAIAARASVAFLALPHGESARAARELRAAGLRVLDLSADLRLRDPDIHREFYGADAAPELRAEAVYGLVERHRDDLRRASLVAVPGCFPTASILALAPLLAAGLVEATGIVVDAKTGVSGAGRKPTETTHFAEIGEGVRAYKVAAHRHTPEIEQELGRAAGLPLRLTFTPHLVPMTRGILSTCYATPTDPSRPPEAYAEALRAAYAGEPFVAVRPIEAPPDTAHVRGSNRVHLAATYDRRAARIIALGAIDNLVKGASGQAIQCLNVMMGWEETAGLTQVGLFP